MRGKALPASVTARSPAWLVRLELRDIACGGLGPQPISRTDTGPHRGVEPRGDPFAKQNSATYSTPAFTTGAILT